MSHGEMGPVRGRPMVVRVPVEPVEAAVEADAADAAARVGDLAVRGPLFGVAVQHAGDGQRWQVVVPVMEGCPQRARDNLNSLLWFRARDDAQDRAERRALLAAVARLETERVDDLVVGESRYRIVRAEEYACTGPDGMELPRPTDPEPPHPDWSLDGRDPEIDDGLLLDPDAPVTPTQAAEQLALRDLHYTGDRFPGSVLADSLHALDTHPDILLMPATFTVVQQSENGWKPVTCLHASVHAARRSLDFTLRWSWPRMRGLIPFEAIREIDPQTLTTPDAADNPELAPYMEAAARLRNGRVNRLEFQGTAYQIARTRRLLRWGPDGPEGPRPSDTNSQAPERMHPPMDEDGNILPEDDFDEDFEDFGDFEGEFEGSAGGGITDGVARGVKGEDEGTLSER
ncbi:DUF5954 family protein [Streptomyces clavuligerus]|uniref:DUF5954 family protein n=1 Tax=Streptomyces clavuligerus TaxID=1901 RepID=UPI001E2D85B7|nr:DUF5954 family protein [Streptomyces clavuligerus]